MLLASSVSRLFKWRQFEPEVILLAVGWYLRFSLSYRDVEELLAERGLHADHVTVWRWVQRYASEMERRLRSRLRPTNDSWRVDETYIRVKGKWVYLYRAVGSTGTTIDFLLSAKRDAAVAERFLTNALGGENHPAPRVINTDKHAGIDRCNISTTFWNRIIGRSSVGYAQASLFSLVLGSLPHDRRLRSDPYDPQRPGVRKRTGSEGRSTPSLSFLVCSAR
jgi:transposase-like protein